MFTLLLSPLFQTFAAVCAKPTFLGLIPWYQYLTVNQVTLANGNGTICQIEGFTGTNQSPAAALGVHSPFFLIAMAILDDLIRVAAYVAVGYVIWGGIRYTTSGGDPNSTKVAQQTIVNALIGLVLAILAASIVTFIGDQLGS